MTLSGVPARTIKHLGRFGRALFSAAFFYRAIFPVALLAMATHLSLRSRRGAILPVLTRCIRLYLVLQSETKVADCRLNTQSRNQADYPNVIVDGMVVLSKR